MQAYLHLSSNTIAHFLQPSTRRNALGVLRVLAQKFPIRFSDFSCVCLIASLLEYSVWCFYKYFPFLQSAKRKNAFNTSTLLQIKHYTTVESFDAFACEMMKIEEPKILYKSHYGRENVTKRKANHRSFYVQTTKKKM